MRKRIISLLLAVVFLTFVFPFGNLTVSAAEDTGYVELNNFINNSLWSDGAYYPNGYGGTTARTPITEPGADWSGCGAYCYDYTNSSYGTHPKGGSPFYSISDVRAGDVIHCTYGGGTPHWYVVLKRSNNSLYTAEAWANYARVGWNYSINGSTIYRGSTATSFNEGYHFNPTPTTPAPATYTDSIHFYALEMQGYGDAGKNSNSRLLSSREFTKQNGEKFTLSYHDVPSAAPNGFYIVDDIGTSGFSSWADYPFGYIFTQPGYHVGFELYCRPIVYTITYVLNGGTNSPDNPSSYTVLNGVTFNDPTREGYVFTGWTDENGNQIIGINPGATPYHTSSSDLYSRLASRTTNNRTVYANWEPEICETHTFGEWQTKTAPTCVETGIKEKECTVCGYVETETIPALGHDYAAVVTAPTCTEDGYTTYTCTRCSDTYVSDEVPANGHSFGEWSVTTEPTCTETGVKKRICSVCSAVEEDTVHAFGHDWSAWYNHPINTSKEIRYCLRCEATETRNKEIIPVDEIRIEKLTAYDVKLTGLDPTLSYVIRYATGEYATASAVKKGTNAGFVQISGVSEAIITLPTHGLHTISAQVGSEVVFIGTVSIDESDMQKEVEISIDDLNLRVLNLYGATRVNLLDRYGNIIMKINPSSFTTDGLKTWADVELPASDHYVLRVMFGNEYIETPFDAVVPAANISTNGRIFTLSDYGAGNVSYIRFAKGVITTAAEMKFASDMRAFGAKYFKNDTASFAALDAVNGETTTYTVQIGYASGYTEFVTFGITPTVPVITTTSDSITLSNVQTDNYYIDWVRCAPGELSSLYAIRHAKGSQVKKTEHIVNDTIVFDGLTPGKYTLYYLYDGWNLSEGMVTVTVN